jgi:hypothetical protein
MDISKTKIVHWLNTYCYQEMLNNEFCRAWPSRYSYQDTIHITSLIIDYPHAFQNFFFVAIQIR